MSDLPQRMNKTPQCSVCLKRTRWIDPESGVIICINCDLPEEKRADQLPVATRIQPIQAIK